jgi:hypothetical protein
MIGRRRLLLGVALAAVSLAAFVGAQRWWAARSERAGAPPANKMEGEAEREARLERQLQAVRKRTEAKWQVVRQLLAGRLTLREAAARFGALNDEPADCPCRDDHFPGATRGERLCRQVIAWVREEAREGQAEAAEAAACLEAELEALLARGARLPG